MVGTRFALILYFRMMAHKAGCLPYSVWHTASLMGHHADYSIKGFFEIMVGWLVVLGLTDL